MGSWNGTCHISGLSIPYGERVVWVPVCQSYPPNLGFPTYSTDIYAPLAFWIRGEYNDYGSIENVDDDEAYKMLMQVGETDRFVFRRREDDGFLSDIERGNVKIKWTSTKGHEESHVLYIMVLEEVFDFVIDQIKKELCYDGKTTLEHAEDDVDFLFSSVRISETMKRYNIQPSINWCACGSQDLYQFSELMAYQDFNVSETKKFIKHMIELDLSIRVFNQLRISFAPTCGGGSQDVNYKFRMELARKTIEVAERLEHIYDDE